MDGLHDGLAAPKNKEGTDGESNKPRFFVGGPTLMIRQTNLSGFCRSDGSRGRQGGGLQGCGRRSKKIDERDRSRSLPAVR